MQTYIRAGSLKLSQRILPYLALQLFVTLVSLPFLVAWGLPLSLLAPIGNLVFAPVLSMFLLASSLLFFTELLHIPNSLIVWSLEFTSHMWQMIMPGGWQWPLVAFARPSLILLSLIPAIALLALHFRPLIPIKKRVLALSMLLCLTCFTLQLFCAKKATVTQIACGNNFVSLVHVEDGIVLVDTGAMGQRQSSASWAAHTLPAEVAKLTGRTHIDHVVTLRPTTFTFAALEAMHRKMSIGHTYVPLWDGKLKKSAWSAFRELKDSLAEKGSSLIRFGKKERTIIRSGAEVVQIQPTQKTITIADGIYPITMLACCVDARTLQFYPAGHKPRESKPNRNRRHEKQESSPHRCT